MKEDENAYSSNPRIQFAINSRTARTSSDNDLSSPPFHGKSHVLISLLQDCRHGPSTVNSLLVPIGLWVYKVGKSGPHSVYFRQECRKGPSGFFPPIDLRVTTPEVLSEYRHELPVIVFLYREQSSFRSSPMHSNIR